MHNIYNFLKEVGFSELIGSIEKILKKVSKEKARIIIEQIETGCLFAEKEERVESFRCNLILTIALIDRSEVIKKINFVENKEVKGFVKLLLTIAPDQTRLNNAVNNFIGVSAPKEDTRNKQRTIKDTLNKPPS
ncbi:MAG: hypothetical protein PHT54_02690 [Candidatus Nanoarchaeia archaeon]|nr:hypothetical protein [Candidatus Nanoarchaeia archaeon]